MDGTIYRNRLYALISALEEDLRSVIRTYLLDGSASEQELLGYAHDDARNRYYRNIDAAVGAGSDIFDFLDLGEEISVVHRWRDKLPPRMRGAIDASKGRLDRLVPIRNRVMHSQPLLPDDADTVQRWLGDLDAGGFAGDTLRAVLREMRTNLGWSPTATFSTPVVPNNLPLGDHDETGLLGRAHQLERVRSMLLRRKYPVVTLIGPGGVGKTALALEVLHSLANSPECPYKAILWVSLKTERLSAAGVQSIREAVRTLEQAIPRLAEPLDGAFSGGVDELAALLDGTDVLLAIDNLETISGNEVLEFIDRLPPTVTYLLTSREGLGAVEYPERVAWLDLDVSVRMFQRLAAAYHVQRFEKLPRTTLEQIQDEVGRSPLHIKWFVLCAAAGQDLETIREHRTDLVQFCVQNVYRGLSAAGKDVAGVLAVGDRPQAVADMRLLLPEIGPDELRRATRDLLVRSLCTCTMDEQLIERFQPTDTLIEYLKRVGADNDDARKRVTQVEDDYRRAEERLRAERERTPLRAVVVNGSDTHRGSALGLRNALALSKRGDLTGALHMIDEIEQLDPEFWELHRVRAFLLSFSGRIDAATRAFERAIELAPNEMETARVRYFYAVHLIGKARDAHRAVAQARIAHDVFQRPETAFELGRTLTYDRQFQDAVAMLRLAGTGTDPLGQLIACTQLVDTLRRRAEVEADELRSPEVALNTLAEAIDAGLSRGDRDERLDEQLYRCVSDALRIADRLPATPDRDDGLRGVLRVVPICPLVNAGRAGKYVVAGARRLLAAAQLPPDVAEVLTSLGGLAADADPNGTNAGDDDQATALAVPAALAGRVKTWKPDRRFGFIAVDGEGDFFFHSSDLDQPLDQIYMTRGLSVEFEPTTNNDKPRATAVRLRLRPATSRLRQRKLTVFSKDTDHCLAVDDQSGVRVRIDRPGLADEQTWDTLAEGTSLRGDLETSPRGGYAAVTGTVALR